MDQFVCVRIPQANDIDLTTFQFDFDLTFAVLFMNSDGTIYGRYGTRSRREATQDISLDGLAAAMSGALTLHERHPNDPGLAGKQAAATQYKTPNEFPSLRGRFKEKIDYGANVVQSCMHCHEIPDAQRQIYRDAGQPIPDQLLFPYPMPDVLGFSLDQKTRATVDKVAKGSAAERAGLQEGDEILTLAKQPIVSTADVQWVLHTAKPMGELEALVRRAGKSTTVTIPLEKDWRRGTDISWRVTSWSLRRMGTGGLKLRAVSDEERQRAQIAASRMALYVEHVGQFGPHAVAKQAGFKQGDIIISFDGQSNLMTDSQLLAYAAQHTKANDVVPVAVLRGNQRLEMKLPMQK